MMQAQHWMATLRRPRWAWLAMLLVLFGAVAPTLSHALAAASAGQPFGIEVCTSGGSRWVSVGHNAGAPEVAGLAASTQPDSANGEDGSPASLAPLVHCPFCLLGANPMAPPPAPSDTRFSPAGLPHEAPRPAGNPPRSASFILVAAPRGPPFFS